MPTLVARVIVGLVVMLSTPVVFTIIMVVLMNRPGRRMDDELGLVTASLLTAGFCVLAWIALWARAVRWTPGRVAMTAIVMMASTVAAFLVAGTISMVSNRHSQEGPIMLGAMVWGLAWFGLTPLVWKETAAERAARHGASGIPSDLPCPACGYNLTGLTDARCPECGQAYRLEQLFAEVASRGQELESRG